MDRAGALAVTAGCVLSVWMAGCGASDPEAKRPSSGIVDMCAVALAAPAGERDDRIAATQDRVRAGGKGSKLALEQLGYHFVARARTSNDPGDYKLAEAAAACLKSRFPGEPAALLLRGHVFHQLHRFAEAEQVARALTGRREFVLDYALLGDALMEQGRLDEAADAYQKMIDLKPFYQSYTRAAHLRWLKGDLRGARELIELAIASASPRDADSIAWACTRLALYELQSGRFRQAMSAVESALAHEPAYGAALLVKGRVLLAQGRLPDAVAPLRRAAALNTAPEYQWTLADAMRAAGATSNAEAVERDLAARGAQTDPRTLALFLATRSTDVDRALTLAEEELTARADVFTLDALAWAQAAAGRLSEARETMRRALGCGTRDARLFLHAGAIAAATGHQAEARRWLARALPIRYTLLPSERQRLRAELRLTATP